MDEAHVFYSQQIDDGLLRVPHGLNRNLVLGQRADIFVRERITTYAGDIGLDATQILINRRYYGANGRYSVPDIRFPQSGNIIDYSYQFKTANTPQIMQFRASPATRNITIIPPNAFRPIYHIGP
jgi:hypothetical protein